MDIRKHIEPKWIALILQIISFVFVILPGLFSFPIPILSPLFFLLEGLTIYTTFLKKFNNYFYFLWQFQFFTYILIQILSNPLVFFQIDEIQIQSIITLLFILGSMETLIIIYTIFKEASIKKILLILSMSTTALVFLMILFVAMQGIPAFYENDPYELLLGSSWKPNYHLEHNDTLQLTTIIEQDECTIQVEDNNLYLNTAEERTISVFIENQINESMTLSTNLVTSKSITAVLSMDIITLEPFQKVSINLTISAAQKGHGFVTIFADSDSSSFQTITNISIFADREAVDIHPHHITIQESALESNKQSPIFQVSNHGIQNDEFQIIIDAPSFFRPSISEGLNGSWDYSSSTGLITLKAGETRNITLTPRMIQLNPGKYTLNITCTSLTNPDIIEQSSITYIYKANEYITSESYEKRIHESNTAVFTLHVDIPTETHEIKLSGVQPGWIVVFYDEDFKPLFKGENNHIIDVKDIHSFIFYLKVTPLEERTSDSLTTTLKIIQYGNKPTIGIFPFIIGTILTSTIAILIAAPLGIGSALFLAEYCPKKLHTFLRPVFELLAGIPSILYGLWAAYTFAPLLANNIYPIITNSLGKHIWFLSGTESMANSILTASIVLAIMILPIIITLSEDSLRSVSRGLKEGSYAMGATKLQTIRKMILPNAKSGIITSMILATGRAIGETMAVLMIMGLSTQLPSTLFDRGGTMTSAIALAFEYSIGFPLTSHILFAIALVLFIMVFILIIIVNIMQREKKNQKEKSLIKKLKNKMNEKNKNIKNKETTNQKFKIVESIQKKRFIILETINKKTSFSSYKRHSLFKEVVPPKNNIFIFKEKFFQSLIILSAIIVSLFLVYIIGDILIRGGLSIKPEFFFLPEIQGGLSGGYANAIVGSLQLTLFALIFAAPLSIAAAIYIQEYTKKDNFITKTILFASDTLASTPSIVFGAFGFAFFVMYLRFKWSLFAGGMTLGIMIIPLILRSSVEAIKVIPQSYKEGALALGATKWQSIRSVILPPATPTIISGVIISMGRAMGETAAVLFTAGYAAGIATSIFSPTGSMPNMIYNYYSLYLKYPILKEKIFSAGAVLIIVILILNSVSRIISYHYGRMMKE